MRILPLKNTILNLEIRFFRSPKEEKLRKELSNFFEQNPIEGYIVKNFSIKGNYIFPEDALCWGRYPTREHSKGLRKIGKKYGLQNLDFYPGYYPK